MKPQPEPSQSKTHEKLLSSNINSFEVWRLTAELEPSSRSRSLGMAQALVGFPSMSRCKPDGLRLDIGKIANERERLSSVRNDDLFKAGDLFKGNSTTTRQHVMVDINELQSCRYERSNQTWSAENILSIKDRSLWRLIG